MTKSLTLKNAVLINDTSNELHLGSKLVINTIKRLCDKYNIILKFTFTRKQIESKDKTTQSHIRNILSRADIIIVNGEGSLHHSPFFFSELLRLLPSGKKTVLINTVWQKMYFENLPELEKFSLISLRESKSYDELLSCYPHPEKMSIVPDLIFYNNISAEDIGYGDSVMNSLKISLNKSRNYFPLNYIDNLPSLEAYTSWLKSLKLHVTGRFHGVCLSAMTRTPFLAFPSNSHKIEGILKDMGCTDLLITSFQQITGKRKLAKELIDKAHKYYKNAQPQIEELFKKIGKL